jgi:uncharacterized membrane protein
MLLLVVQPAQIRALVRVLTQDELSEDPHEALAKWLARLADRIDVDSLTFAAVYLLGPGVVDSSSSSPCCASDSGPIPG